jgi:transposase
LQKEQLRLSNQLRDVLKQYYPIANHLFSKLHQPLTLAFLQAFPSPQAAQAASLEELTAFFVAYQYRWMSKVADKYALLQTPMPVHPTPAGLVTHMLALVAVLQSLTAQLSQLKRHIRTALRAHPEADWWLALPGSGLLTAARLLAYIGDNRDRFPSAQTLQVYGGTVPVTQQSGKRVRVFFRQNCHHALRDAITDLAANSRAKSGWALSYYRSQRSLGHDHTRAIRALANRWFKVIWTIWQRHEAYDEAFHVANRSRRGLPRPIAA